MKTASDPRHENRRKVVQELFAESFSKQKNVNMLTSAIVKKVEELDAKIAKSAPAWPIDKLNRIDLSILRLAVFELEEGLTPPKVVIDEAVELAKEFGSENSASFINGVLGTIYGQDK